MNFQSLATPVRMACEANDSWVGVHTSCERIASLEVESSPLLGIRVPTILSGSNVVFYDAEGGILFNFTLNFDRGMYCAMGAGGT